MDWRKLKVGQTIWYVNTSPWDYDSPHPSSCLELWRGTVKKIDPDAARPVECYWDRVGGHANWVRPEWAWCRMISLPSHEVENLYEAPNIFPTAEEAIEAYLAGPREKLMAQATKLKGA